MTWLQTASGRAFDLLNPDWRQVDFDIDIPEALARIARFTGHVRSGVYSVAQHCVLGADAIYEESLDRELAAAFLLHDAHEAYLGDIATPIAQALAAEADFQADVNDVDIIVKRAISALKHRIDVAIFHAAGLGYEGMSERHVLRCRAHDRSMLATERALLLGRSPRRWHEDVERAKPIRLPGKLTCWPWPDAADRYREALRRYLPERFGLAPSTPRPVPRRDGARRPRELMEA